MPAHIDYGARVRIWDHPKTADRYTILPPRTAGDEWRGRGREWQGIAASAHPFHPQGIGMHIEAPAGSHLGKRLHWHELPADVQRFARQTFPAVWLPQSED
jgi:hypothetical protein